MNYSNYKSIVSFMNNKHTLIYTKILILSIITHPYDYTIYEINIFIPEQIVISKQLGILV